MFRTYIPSSNTATNGVAIGNANDASGDVMLRKLLIGAPVSAGNIFIYDITNPVNGASTNIAAKITLPTFSTTNVNPGLYVVDFTDMGGGNGLVLSGGGNIIIDQTMQVTAIWDYVDDAN